MSFLLPFSFRRRFVVKIQDRFLSVQSSGWSIVILSGVGFLRMSRKLEIPCADVTRLTKWFAGCRCRRDDAWQLCRWVVAQRPLRIRMRPDISPSLEGHFPVTSMQPAVYLFLTGFVKKTLLLEATNELFVEISLAEVLARKSVSSNLYRLLRLDEGPGLGGRNTVSILDDEDAASFLDTCRNATTRRRRAVLTSYFDLCRKATRRRRVFSNGANAMKIGSSPPMIPVNYLGNIVRRSTFSKVRLRATSTSSV